MYWILSAITGMIIVLPTAFALFGRDVRVIPSAREIVVAALRCTTGVLFFCTPSDPFSYWQFPVLTLPLFVVCAARLPPMVMSLTAVFVASV